MPKKPQPLNGVGLMARLGMSNHEIADTLGVNEGTIRRRCAVELKKNRAEMRRKLRSTQIKLALKGNTALLIWLGKCYLGQTDRTELQAQIKAIRPIGFNLPPKALPKTLPEAIEAAESQEKVDHE